jgi:uncharacterized membrane protein
MTGSLPIAVLVYLHVISLSLWFGGLFAYLVIVWPALMIDADGEFPRAILARIAMRTAPWIYLGMSVALLSLAAIWTIDGATRTPWMVGYSFLLVALVANNLYGSAVAWPRIMLLPRTIARREWFWFRVRMSVSLIVGLALYSAALIAT